MKKYANIFLSLLLIFSACSQSEKRLTYTDVVLRLVNLETLSLLPEKGEKSAMWSSYDRRSQFNAENGKYVEWYANHDGANQQIRMEGENAVLAEMKGPGAIVRIWSAMPDSGRMKIYIDDNELPAVDLPFKQFFDGSKSPFDYKNLVYKAAEGCNNFVPIPYQKSCKVVATPGWGIYYHFNYVTFQKSTQVEPFKMNLSVESTQALEMVNHFFENQMGESPYFAQTGNTSIKKSITVEPGSIAQLTDISGQYAIKSFKIFPAFTDRKDEMVGLRKLILTMNWDGEEQPSVWCPLGDFFGTTPAINHFKTLPLGMTAQNFYSYWWMPFAKHAAISIKNEGARPYTFEYEISYGPLSNLIENYARFHAWWHGDILPVSEDRWPDWTLLKTTGKGRYIGTMLHVMNPDENSCKEAAGEGHAWWGEGDEKFFVDGEKFPSTFGTGSEDYFGYAWGNPTFFEKAFHSQSMTSGNKGHQTIARWHIIDNIPFQESFEGYIEKYYPNDCGTKYNAVVYWYLSPNGINPMPASDVTVDYLLLPPAITLQNNPAPPGGVITAVISSEGDEIRYTLDGTMPDQQSMLYSGAFKITKNCTIKARSYGDGGESRVSRAICRILEWQNPVSAPSGLVNGLKYSYYERDGLWEVLPDFSIMSPKKTGRIEKVMLGVQEREDHWGVVFEGYIKIEIRGVYSFFLNSDDGSRMYLADELIVDNDRTHGTIEVAGSAALEKGFYPIRIEFFENELWQVLEMRYKGPGIEKIEVPGSILFCEEK
ncbi:DUF2961 domain-containing protein [candidate division KSB1 bacterium]|nr:DUF2961 domain-containing protein [candidate division KSB1 bacterium]